MKMIDIARQAKVSIATVDRVINGRAPVRKLTSDRVWEAVEQLKVLSNQGTASNSTKNGEHIDFFLPLGAGPSIEENLKTAITHLGTTLNIDVRCHYFERFNPEALSEKLLEVSQNGGCKGVVIHSLEHPLVRQTVRHLWSQETPCVSLLSELSNSPSIGYAGIDNRAAGRTAGYLMGRFLQGRKAKVAVICGSTLYRSHEEREMGYRSMIRESFPNLEVLDIVVGGDEPEANFKEVSQLLRKHDDLLGIYSVGSGNRGIVQAFSENHKREDMVVIVHNLTAISRQFLLEGSVDIVIHQDMEKAAGKAIDLLIQAKQTKPNERIPFEILLRENILS
ncbi:MAG: LacI family DNA-binding transcriptional regulator [Arenicella sp.]